MAATGMEALLSRRRAHLPGRGRAGRVRQRRGRRPRAVAAHRRQPQHARPGARHVPLRQRHGRHLDGGRGARRLIQRELLTRTAMLDCGTQARTWELLRLTRMPTVRVEVGYLTNMGDRRRLLDPVVPRRRGRGRAGRRQTAVPARAGRPADRHVHVLGDVLARELDREEATVVRRAITRADPSAAARRALSAPAARRRRPGAGPRRRRLWTAAGG